MSPERDPRAEAAEIAHALRRIVERQRAAGHGELLAASVAAARATALESVPASVGAPRQVAQRDAPLVADAPRARADADPRAGAADAPRAVVATEPRRTAILDEPSSPLDGTEFSYTLPSHHDPLHSIGLAERAAILGASTPVLDAVAAEARACRQCGLCETRTHAVPGVGSARSGIVFVGEAPGADEDAQGEPFVGRAGQLLTKIIQAMDDAKLIKDVPLDRSTVYICNVLKCRPPENRNPLPGEIESCSPYLRRQLAALQPRIICCLGKFAAELLVGVKGTIASMRGKVYRYQGAKLLVTYHPAACLRNPGYKRPVWEDMQTLAREYQTD